MHLLSFQYWASRWGVLLVVIFVLSGCLIPPHLNEAAADASADATEVLDFLWKSSTPSRDVTINEYQTPFGEAKRVTLLNLALVAPLIETLSLRFFIDLQWNTIVKEVIKTKRPETKYITEIIEIEGLCDNLVNKQTGIHFLEIYVSNDGFDDVTGQRLGDYRIVPAKAFRIHDRWVINCRDELPPGT